MSKRSLTACLVLTLVGSWPSVLAEDKPKAVRVLIETGLGTIEAELDAARAPATVVNFFLKYVDGKFYDGGRFHRTVKPDNQPANKVKIEVVQAGINPKKAKDEFPAIKLERAWTSSRRFRPRQLRAKHGRRPSRS